MRKKLIDLIGYVQDDGCDYTECFSQWDRPNHIDNSVLADYLIANDVVQVVRCKDCKHSSGTRIEPKTCVCFRHGIIMFGDHFCAWGKRRDNETNNL